MFVFRRHNRKSTMIQAQTSRRKGEAVPCVSHHRARLYKPYETQTEEHCFSEAGSSVQRWSGVGRGPQEIKGLHLKKIDVK